MVGTIIERPFVTGGPGGFVISRARSDPQTLVASLDLDKKIQRRLSIPFLRPTWYEPLRPLHPSL